MLASAVAAGKDKIDTGYDVPKVAQYVLIYFGERHIYIYILKLLIFML